MFLKAVFELFIFDNIVSLWMLELHLAAYASLFDRSPSILLLPACRKLSLIQRRGTCWSQSPLKLFSHEASSPWGLYPAQDASSSPPAALGQGRSGMWWCNAGRASSGPSQIRVSSAHRAAMILYVLFNSWGLTHRDRAFPSSVPLPSFSLVLFFNFNYYPRRNKYVEVGNS